MEENILRELVKSKKILKKKFDSIKQGEVETFNKLEQTFKPLTEPLKKLVKLTDENSSNFKVFKDENLKFDDTSSIKIKKKCDSITASTPIKKEHFAPLKQNDSEANNTEMDNESFYSQPSEMELTLTGLYENQEFDTIYGPYKTENDKWKLGNLNIKLNEDKVTIGNKNWALTPGLYSLLFHKKPKQYDETELHIYKQILIDTNAHRRNFNANSQINGNRGYKYKAVISKLFATTYTGEGLMKVNLTKPNYIYWDDPNEIVDRLKLLVASQQAGHNNHTNEIVSIIEELREANIIE